RRLLDDLLGLLSRRVGGRLIDELQALTVLRANAVRAPLPPGLLQQRVGLVDVELPLHIARSELRRRVQEVSAGPALTTVDLLLDRGPVHKEVQSLAHRGVAERRLLGLRAGP